MNFAPTIQCPESEHPPADGVSMAIVPFKSLIKPYVDIVVPMSHYVQICCTFLAWLYGHGFVSFIMASLAIITSNPGFLVDLIMFVLGLGPRYMAWCTRMIASRMLWYMTVPWSTKVEGMQPFNYTQDFAHAAESSPPTLLFPVLLAAPVTYTVYKVLNSGGG
eukprot:2497050-Karenia_brevis.AAC.1